MKHPELRATLHDVEDDSLEVWVIGLVFSCPGAATHCMTHTPPLTASIHLARLQGRTDGLTDDAC